MGKVYQYKAMPFGINHSTIFISQALAIVLTKKRSESDICVLNYVDNLLILHQDKERLRKQSLIIMGIQKHLSGQQPRRNEKQNQNNRLTSQGGLETWKGCME
ncbi:MAG: hypothetical protein EZS28_045967 [Streblomastix strix]|uniref:Reverse transcriptase domain-containing protein n=1 Tax=Streblomastix strix TaxID=222440 RepID=A0A5J4TJR8_9EUKA|nr:MAG: hypothetical protein EZS28_045967 [Streblomastix strix]